jgi:uncharacterized membrane protein
MIRAVNEGIVLIVPGENPFPGSIRTTIRRFVFTEALLLLVFEASSITVVDDDIFKEKKLCAFLFFRVFVFICAFLYFLKREKERFKRK